MNLKNISFLIIFVIIAMNYIIISNKYKITENYLALGGNRDEFTKYYNTPGFWEATGEQSKNKDYVLKKSKPFSLENQDIKAIFNFDNRVKQKDPFDFECDENAMSSLLYSTFKIKSFFRTNNYLVFANNDILVKKYEYPPFNLSTEWSFVPVNQNANDCIVFIVNYKNGINDLAQHYITAPNSSNIETMTFTGTPEQYWKIIFDKERIQKENNTKIYFYIKSYYHNTYMTYVEQSIGVNSVYLQPNKTENALWYVYFSC
jgi:ribosome-associated toxin RatA of RatAB toxin-antitoxin module